MALPNPISITAIAGLKENPLNYESHRKMVQEHNQLISALGPGTAVRPLDFSITGFGTGATISSVDGTFKRGKLTVTCGTAGISANPKIVLTFPSGLYNSAPFAQVVRNGGTGTIGFTYTESVNNLTINMVGTPGASQTFTLQWAVRE